MEVSIVTEEDLLNFKNEVFEELRNLKEELLNNVKSPEEIKLLKSHQVQRMLSISPGTLQNLRVNGTIPFSKIGGVIFYDKKDIMKVFEENKRNI